MKHSKILVKISGITISISLLMLLYNFFNMYSLVGKCPDDIDVKPCQAYSNWVTINKVGLIILAIGLMFVTIGLLKSRQNKP